MFSWLAYWCRYVRAGIAGICETGSGLAIVGGWIASLDSWLTGWFEQMAIWFDTTQTAWDELTLKWRVAVDEFLDSLEDWVIWLRGLAVNFVEPLYSILDFEAIKAWIKDEFVLTRWVDEARDWMASLSATWITWVQGLLETWSAAFDDWITPFREVLSDADIASWVANRFDLATWLFEADADLRNTIRNITIMIAPVWPWGQVKAWLDEKVEDERDWLYAQAVRVLDRLW